MKSDKYSEQQIEKKRGHLEVRVVWRLKSFDFEILQPSSPNTPHKRAIVGADESSRNCHLTAHMLQSIRSTT